MVVVFIFILIIGIIELLLNNAHSPKIKCMLKKLKGKNTVEVEQLNKICPSIIWDQEVLKQNMSIDNMGPGSTLKKDNNFDEDVTVSLKMLDEEPFTISNCHFKILDNSNSAVFYVKGKNGNLAELSDCTFEGYLAKGGHFIDGVSTSNDSPKMLIKSCKFLSNESDSLLSLSDALTTNRNDAFVNSIRRKKRTDSKKTASIIVAVTAAITFNIIFIMIFITAKKKNLNSLDGDDEMLSIDNSI